MRLSAASLSAALHVTAVAFVLWLFRSEWNPPRPPPAHSKIYLSPVARPLHRAGGGQREVLRVSRGNLPPKSLRPLMPLMIQPVNLNPRISVAPAILDAPDIEIPRIATDRLGTPFGVDGPPSGGLGGPNGIGDHGRGGVGNDDGVGVEGTVRRDVIRVRGQFTAPVLLYKTEPEYSEDARKAKVQGVVVLVAEVGPNGRLTNIRVMRPLGLGLEDQAVRAVADWRFKPALQNGRPVSSSVTIEVNFRLL